MSPPSNTNTRWLEHLSRANPPFLRLFCFPYAGGSATVYRGWQRWFPDQIDICLVHLPGRGRRINEQSFTRLEALVTDVAEYLISGNDVPYAFYGHSMGALISFELCRELRRRQYMPPEHLFVSGRRAPQLTQKDSPRFNLPREEFINRLEQLNGTPPEVLENPELLEIFIDVLRADFELAETYQYSPEEPLSCPITVYGGLQDKDVCVESCRAWREQTSASCTPRLFNGDHFFIRNPAHEFRLAFAKDVLNAVPAWRRDLRDGPGMSA